MAFFFLFQADIFQIGMNRLAVMQAMQAAIAFKKLKWAEDRHWKKGNDCFASIASIKECANFQDVSS